MSRYGRYQVAEPPSNLRSLHLHDGFATLRTVDHEPKVGVLDQQDLLRQGILCSQFIPGATDVDALGSCTANATIAALSNTLSAADFGHLVLTLASRSHVAGEVYRDVKTAEEAAIGFYHVCTDQTGDPSQEWPPTDCGSSGPFIVSELQALKVIRAQRIAHGAENLVSLLQIDGVLMGSPWLYAWEEPDHDGFIDGNGSLATLRAQLLQGVAGGHQTYLAAIEQIVKFPTGRVDPRHTIIRIRNSWDRSWGDHGCCRVHLSTLISLGGACDFRQLVL